MKTNRRKVVLAGLMAPAALGIAGRAGAQNTDYYKDKVLLINVAGGPSGGHNRYARPPPSLQSTAARRSEIVNMPCGGGLKGEFLWAGKQTVSIFFARLDADTRPAAGSRCDVRPDEIFVPRARHERAPRAVRRREIADQVDPGRPEAEAALRISVAGHRRRFLHDGRDRRRARVQNQGGHRL